MSFFTQLFAPPLYEFVRFVVIRMFLKHFFTIISACDSNLSGLTGTFTSPNYPSNYPDGKTCTTTITAPTGKIIKLKFMDFDLEEVSDCYFDSVEIKDGAITKKYCGKKIPPEYVSKGNIITVKFVSDVMTNGKGFSASYIVSGRLLYFITIFVNIDIQKL